MRKSNPFGRPEGVKTVQNIPDSVVHSMYSIWELSVFVAGTAENFPPYVPHVR